MFNIILQTCFKFRLYSELHLYLSNQFPARLTCHSETCILFKSFVCSEISKSELEEGVLGYVFFNLETGQVDLECGRKIDSTLDAYAGILYFLLRM